MVANEIAISAHGIQKHFGATRALRGVDFTLRRGEIHALLGGNGAGKSTLIRILSGEMEADSGDLQRDVNEIAVVHQELTIMRDLTVAENISLSGAGGWRLFPWRQAQQAAWDALGALGLGDGSVNPRALAGDLPLHQMQLVEIGRCLATGASVMLLDEPTAALTAEETQTFFGVLRRLRDQGMAMIFVSHRMEEIRQIADRLTILRDGETAVHARPVGEISDSEVLREMFGAQGEGERAPRQRIDLATREQVLRFEHADLHEPVAVAAGEVLGLAGAPVGPQAFINMVLGTHRPQHWSVHLLDGGTAIQPRRPRHAIRSGIGYVSGDRAHKGIFPELSIYDNTLVSRQVVSGNLLNRLSARRVIDGHAEKLGFAHQDLRLKPRSLSGGTQQKLLIARWLDMPLRVLLLEEPTRGVDLRTKTDLYEIVRQIADRGCAVIWWSTEFAELRDACDRVMAFNVTGEPVGIFDVEELTEEALLAATGTT